MLVRMQAGKKRTFIHWLWECKMVQLLWKAICWFLKKTKHISAIDPAIPLLGIPEGMQLRLLQRYLHTHVYCRDIHNSLAMETAKMSNYTWMD
jgi:hypothetical protein